MNGELRPFRIGPACVDFPVILAPLAGYTDAVYRRICRDLGAPYCATEMLLDTSVLANSKQQRRMLRIGQGDHPLAAQLIGREPDTMARAAAVLCGAGFDVIDLNFACPVRKALARRRGGYLLQEPQRALDITRAVIAAADRPVTLKLRRRFRKTDTDEAFWQIAEGAFDAGAAAVCIHARNVEQKYTGRADWEFLALAKRRFPERTVIGSGDVLAPADALAMLERTGVDAVAVARGALGNPWFFRQARDIAAGREPYTPGLAEQRRLLADHFEQACGLYGPVKGPKIMRKFGARYARVHPSPRAVRMAFVAVKKPADWARVLDDFYRDAQPADERSRSI